MKKQVRHKFRHLWFAAAIATVGLTLFPSSEAWANNGRGRGRGQNEQTTTSTAETGNTTNSSATEDVSGIDFFQTSVKCEDGVFSGTTACEGVFSGNDSNTITESTELFGETGWKELTKINTDGKGSYANGLIEFSGPLDGNELKNDIQWAFKDGIDFSNVSGLFFSVKGGPSFSTYLWDKTTLSGIFDTGGIVKGNGKAAPGLSHLSVYYRGDVYLPPEATVPTPAAVLPVLGSLFGVASKRKKQEEDSAESDEAMS